MLKRLSYDGTYRDETLSVGVSLENPTEHGLELSTLTFGVTVRAKNGDGSPLKLDNFTFYVMDEANRLYNTRVVPVSAVVSPSDDDEPVRQPDGLICTGLRPDFLFQDLRVGFFYRPYESVKIIGLST